jgi:low temperature requirement protein LtrA
MTSAAVVRPKRVSFLELFFDLVFVFAVTQMVGLLMDDPGAAGWGRAALVLWLVWWAWSQYAWAGNAIDLDRRVVRLAVLATTGAMLLAAVAIPSAFGGSGLWFAVPYVVVRLVGLGLYWFGLADDPEHQAALRTYLPVQCLSPLLIIIGGFTDPDIRVWLWTAAVVIDVVSVALAGRGEFRIDPAHFAERHGLIVIIALGESIVAIGATAADVGLDRTITITLAIAYIAVAALWWSYFDWVHGAAEDRLDREIDNRRRARLARDLFTFWHLPIIAGTVVFAAAIETAIHDPAEHLDTFGVTALAVGPALFLLGFVGGNLRATGRLLWTRVVGLVAIVVAAVIVSRSAAAIAAIATIAVALVAVATVETLRSPAAGGSAGAA